MKDLQRRYFSDEIPYENPFGVLFDEETTAVVASHSVDILNKAIQSLKARQELIAVRKVQTRMEADYKANRADIEKKIQSELGQVGNALTPLNNPTLEQWLERAMQLVAQAITNKRELQIASNALTAKVPNAPEEQETTYNANLLVDEIANLQTRLNKLNTEMAGHQETVRQAAIRTANTYAMSANDNIIVIITGRDLIQVT